jgi:hypothetical protein
MSNVEKVIIGALGGLSAVLVKFLGQDYATVVAQAANLTVEQLSAYKIGYGLLTPILMFLGAFVAWTSDEHKRVKLVALAIAAPAMITTWSGGNKSSSTSASFDLFVTSAYAQALDAGSKSNQADSPGAIEQIQKGVGIFFGYNKEPKRYWVIVGSYQDRNAAQQFADRINQENKTLNAWVGAKVPPNDYYPVIVGDYSFLSEARALREKALATKSVKEAYLSEGAKR